MPKGVTAGPNRRVRLTVDQVYFLEDPLTGLIKIGHSIDVYIRRMDIERTMGRSLNLLATIDGGLMGERRLHNQFRDIREHGEWFNPSEALRAVIVALSPTPVEFVNPTPDRSYWQGWEGW